MIMHRNIVVNANELDSSIVYEWTQKYGQIRSCMAKR